MQGQERNEIEKREAAFPCHGRWRRENVGGDDLEAERGVAEGGNVGRKPAENRTLVADNRPPPADNRAPPAESRAPLEDNHAPLFICDNPVFPPVK